VTFTASKRKQKAPWCSSLHSLEFYGKEWSIHYSYSFRTHQTTGRNYSKIDV